MKLKNSFKCLICLFFISICFIPQKTTASFRYRSGHIKIIENRTQSLSVSYDGNIVGPIKRSQLIRSLKRLNYWPFRGQKGYIDPAIITLQILLAIKLLHPEMLHEDLKTHYLILLDIASSYLNYLSIQKALAQTPNADNEPFIIDEILAICTGISPLLGVLVEFGLRRLRANMLMSSQVYPMLGNHEYYLKSIEKYTHPLSWIEENPIKRYLRKAF